MGLDSFAQPEFGDNIKSCLLDVNKSVVLINKGISIFTVIFLATAVNKYDFTTISHDLKFVNAPLFWIRMWATIRSGARNSEHWPPSSEARTLSLASCEGHYPGGSPRELRPPRFTSYVTSLTKRWPV